MIIAVSSLQVGSLVQMFKLFFDNQCFSPFRGLKNCGKIAECLNFSSLVLKLIYYGYFAARGIFMFALTTLVFQIFLAQGKMEAAAQEHSLAN